MKGLISDEQRLRHIREAIEEILDYTKGADLAVFKANSMLKFATIKQIEIIGEAAKYISEETITQYPEIPWKQISGLRNILVHEYFGVDTTLIWQIVQTDIPALKNKLETKPKN